MFLSFCRKFIQKTVVTEFHKNRWSFIEDTGITRNILVSFFLHTLMRIRIRLDLNFHQPRILHDDGNNDDDDIMNSAVTVSCTGPIDKTH